MDFENCFNLKQKGCNGTGGKFTDTKQLISNPKKKYFITIVFRIEKLKRSSHVLPDTAKHHLKP